jgi:hypothetical protein
LFHSDDQTRWDLKDSIQDTRADQIIKNPLTLSAQTFLRRPKTSKQIFFGTRKNVRTTPHKKSIDKQTNKHNFSPLLAEINYFPPFSPLLFSSPQKNKSPFPSVGQSILLPFLSIGKLFHRGGEGKTCEKTEEWIRMMHQPMRKLQLPLL